MEWFERMNAALDYIEDNISGEIDYNEAARRACCSTFHFQRIFMVVNEVTVAEYIRRRRLTLAARDLLSGDLRVIDVALKYGYDSPDAFTRAFRSLHGVTPQAARRPGAPLVAYPRIQFHIVLKGGTNMDYRIIEKPAFDIIAKSRRFTTVNKENYVKIPQFWDEFMLSEDYRVLCNLTGEKVGPLTGAGMLGVCIPNQEKQMDEFSYAIGIEKPIAKTPADFEVIHIPGASWAVFECIGPLPGSLQTVNDRIFEEWFPSTGYEHAGAPELEIYPPGDMEGKDYHCQIWIPIIQKKK